ncbi:2-hydroxyacid dehydrogenase [Pectobacterium zantedeschiae]|uniref:Dihydrofolate reductase n=1 Tax=Pectobacterium zantedeschiae TaxID=2034769 RepID=A0A9X8JHH0_9GAMM|nr:2-hydroxyacid dehydrogenase [Pectobacterium zantedeschiae]RYC43823.1 dihydrofolate reductase [Pectobacterium zantedeschiae]RYC48956.1 dihydrofolate reductase [Pectobacterium zantedeschiae]
MKIVFTAEYGGSLDAFQTLGELVVDGWAIGHPKLSEAALIRLADNADVIITSYDDITARVIEACPHLRLIACTRANPVNIDVEAARSRGIPVLYTPGRNADAAAELTLALMLNVTRHIPQAHSALKRGEFTRDTDAALQTQAGLRQDVVWDVDKHSPYEVFKGGELRNKTLGLVGYGSIGRRVGKLARAFGMQLLIADPYVAAEEIDEPGMRKVTLDELFPQSDFVSLHLNSTPQTKGLVNLDRLRTMRPGAYLINTSRAAVVVEADLITALRERSLAGAALDVYDSEPLWRHHPFITEFDNVVLTPHIAGATRETLVKHTAMIATDLQRFIHGEPLLYEWK